MQSRPLLDQTTDHLEELVYILWCEHEARKLLCVECGTTAVADAWGWRMYLTVDDEPAIYCPECAAAEFDGERRVVFLGRYRRSR